MNDITIDIASEIKNDEDGGDDWDERVDPGSGKKLDINSATNETTRDKPADLFDDDKTKESTHTPTGSLLPQIPAPTDRTIAPKPSLGSSSEMKNTDDNEAKVPSSPRQNQHDDTTLQAPPKTLKKDSKDSVSSTQSTNSSSIIGRSKESGAAALPLVMHPTLLALNTSSKESTSSAQSKGSNKSGVKLHKVIMNLRLSSAGSSSSTRSTGSNGANRTALCSICYCRYQVQEMHMVSTWCRHNFCHDCLGDYIRHLVNDGHVHQLSCPFIADQSRRSQVGAKETCAPWSCSNCAIVNNAPGQCLACDLAQDEWRCQFCQEVNRKRRNLLHVVAGETKHDDVEDARKDASSMSSMSSLPSWPVYSDDGRRPVIVEDVVWDINPLDGVDIFPCEHCGTRNVLHAPPPLHPSLGVGKCGVLLTQADVEYLTDRECLLKFKRFTASRDDPHTRSCPNPVGCDHFQTGDPEHPQIVCEKCQFVYCMEHATAHPLEESCLAYTQRTIAEVRKARELVNTMGAKPCPACHLDTVKSSGCNHMTCPCGTHWCWICMKNIDGINGVDWHYSLENATGCPGMQFFEFEAVEGVANAAVVGENARERGLQDRDRQRERIRLAREAQQRLARRRFLWRTLCCPFVCLNRYCCVCLNHPYTRRLLSGCFYFVALPYFVAAVFLTISVYVASLPLFWLGFVLRPLFRCPRYGARWNCLSVVLRPCCACQAMIYRYGDGPHQAEDNLIKWSWAQNHVTPVEFAFLVAHIFVMFVIYPLGFIVYVAVPGIILVPLDTLLGDVSFYYVVVLTFNELFNRSVGVLFNLLESHIHCQYRTDRPMHNMVGFDEVIDWQWMWEHNS